jgi:hypothetical protein
MLNSMSSVTNPDPFDHAERTAQRKASIVVAVAIAAATGACFALWLWSRADETDAVRNLPATERRALYESTLHTLNTVCDAEKQPQGLKDFCNDQALFVLQFPECEETCRAIVMRARSLPAR